MEDQHYNGDIWNQEIVRLFQKFGWNRIVILIWMLLEVIIPKWG